jgi:vacuolar iron transporter family protein
LFIKLLNKLKTRKFEYLPEFVYGGIDGTITTFAIVSGGVGAGFNVNILIILGLANLIADGFSMSIGNFFSNKSQRDNFEKYKAKEFFDISHNRETEIEDIRKIYQKKGFEGALLEQIISVITANPKVWVDTMMAEELMLVKDARTPSKTAFATFLAFVVMGFIPLSAYIITINANIEYHKLFVYACIATAISLSIIGGLKSLINKTGIIRGILETLILGGLAALLAYFVGFILEQNLISSNL